MQCRKCKKELTQKHLNGEKADITFTSPPYCLGDHGRLRGGITPSKTKLYNNYDDTDPNKWKELNQKSFDLSCSYSEVVFWNLQLVSLNKANFLKWLGSVADRIIDICIWKKTNPPPSSNDNVFATCFEFILVAQLEKSTTRKIPGRHFGKGSLGNYFESSVGPGSSVGHLASFPVILPEYFIKNHAHKNVYEPFCGSGSTLIACEKTNRRCFGMEIDPHYCQVIIDRFIKFSGKDVHRIESDGSLTSWNDILSLKTAIGQP